MTCVSSGTISFDARHARPRAEIDLVAADHPAQEQVQPLAGAAGGRPRERNSRRRGAAARAVGAPDVERQRARRKTVERAADVVVRRSRSPRGRSSRSIPTARASAAGSRAARRGRRPASSGGPCARSSGCGAFGSNARTNSAGRGPMMRNSVSTEFSTLADAAERQRRGAEPGDLPIVGRARTAGRSEPDRSPSPRGCSPRRDCRARRDQSSCLHLRSLPKFAHEGYEMRPD